jgi:hypothetical protein
MAAGSSLGVNEIIDAAKESVRTGRTVPLAAPQQPMVEPSQISAQALCNALVVVIAKALPTRETKNGK